MTKPLEELIEVTCHCGEPMVPMMSDAGGTEILYVCKQIEREEKDRTCTQNCAQVNVRVRK